MLILGLAIILLCLGCFSIVLGGNVSDFISLLSLLVIICPLLGILTATRSFKLFYTGFRAAFFPNETVSEKSLRQAVSLFQLMAKAAVAMSVIGILIGFINILINLNFEDAGGIAALGISIAYSLIPLLYGLLFVIALFEPMIFILKKRLSKLHAQKKEIL